MKRRAFFDIFLKSKKFWKKYTIRWMLYNREFLSHIYVWERFLLFFIIFEEQVYTREIIIFRFSHTYYIAICITSVNLRATRAYVCHLESAILISPIARFDSDNSRSTRENRLYLECSIYIRESLNCVNKYIDCIKQIYIVTCFPA